MTRIQKTKPLAILVSDVHYSIATLPEADFCLAEAVSASIDLSVPLIIAGDLNDTKAHLRAECVNAMLATLSKVPHGVTILVGNHDKINEKSSENSLEFLARKDRKIIREETYDKNLDVWFIPYQHDTEHMRSILRKIPDNSRIIMHQGLVGGLPGGYNFDRSAINSQDVEKFQVFSGHYHQHQTSVHRTGNTFTYIGNPYTLDFSEAAHGPKGFIILNDDFTFTRSHIDSVRTHFVLDLELEELHDREDLYDHSLREQDLILVKIRGPKAKLSLLTKAEVRTALRLPTDSFRLDLIADVEAPVLSVRHLGKEARDIFFGILDTDSAEQKIREDAKKLWDEK